MSALTPSRYLRISDLQGLGRLAIAGVSGVTDLVEGMHRTIARPPLLFGRSPDGRTTGITGLVYRSIHGVTRVTGATLDAVMGGLAAAVPENESSAQRDRMLAVLNGVLGDHLEASASPLAIPMSLRHGDTELVPDRDGLASALPRAQSRVLLRVHGLCMNHRAWTRPVPAGFTPVDVHYNSGRPIADNGCDLADLLDRLTGSWPVPVEELVILGHSMGGLVARSACHYAEARKHAWRRRLGRMIFLGTPHHGAPLERHGNRLESVLGISSYSAPFTRLTRIRSAGITDLRHGSVHPEDWSGRDRFAPDSGAHRPVPLPAGVECLAIAATRTRAGGDDGLVPVDSALGRHADPRRDLGIPECRQWIIPRLNHLDLAGHPGLHRRIGSWLVRPGKSVSGRK